MAVREDKYQKIIQAAIEAIAETGFAQCQVSKIARLAGVADGTIYLYFKNKEDILIRLFQETLQEFIAKVSNRLLLCNSIQTRLRAIVETHLNYMEQNRSVAFVAQLELRQADPRIRAAISESILEYYKVIEDAIRQAIAEKEIPEVNVRCARQMIFGAMDQAVTDWVMARNPRSLVNQIQPLLYLFEGALRITEQAN